MGVKKAAKSLAKRVVIQTIASFLYTFGLTLLIPIFMFLLFSADQLTTRFVATAIVAGGCIIFAFVILLSYTNNLRKTLVNMSLFTLIPAVIAILLSFYGQDVLFGTVKALTPNFESVQPLLVNYIETKVPRLTPLIVGYLLVGLSLLWYSRKIRR